MKTNTNDTITIPKKWIEKLTCLAKNVIAGEGPHTISHQEVSALNYLIGYIESAEAFIQK